MVAIVISDNHETDSHVHAPTSPTSEITVRSFERLKETDDTFRSTYFTVSDHLGILVVSKNAAKHIVKHVCNNRRENNRCN